MAEKREKPASNRFLEWVLNLLVAAAVALVAFMFLAPRYGMSVHPVLSGSMEPAIRVGGVVVTRLTEVDRVKEGDVISYKIGEQRITHRVIEVSQADGKIQFRTKGDANEEPDPYAVMPKGEKVPRVVLYLPYVGFLAVLLKEKTNFFLLVGTTAALLVALYVRDIRRELRRGRRRTADS